MRISVAAAVVCLSAIGISTASDVEAAIKTTTNIPAQGLGPALQALAKERGFELLYLSDLVDSLNTSGATGDLTTAEALQKLLSGTGLTYRYLDENTVTVLALSSTSSAGTPSSAFDSATHALSTPQAFNNPDTPDSGTAKKAGFWDRFRLAQNDQSSSSRTSDSDEQEENPPRSSDTNSESRVIDEVLVTGSHIRGSNAGASPVTVYDREQLEQLGVSTAGEILRVLPQNLGTVSASPYSTLGASHFPNLRGLGEGATLVLINGQRPATSAASVGNAPAAPSQINLDVVPVAAIERVEILRDGASAIYGADAVAGVINVILRRNYSGVEMSAKHSFASDVDEQNYSIVAGSKFGRFSGIIGGEYYDRGELLGGERTYSAHLDKRPLGGTNGLIATRTAPIPANISALPGNGNLPGLSSSVAAVPNGSPRALTVSDFVATQGQQNALVDAPALGTLVLPQERTSAFAHADISLVNTFVASVDALYSESSTPQVSQSPFVNSLFGAANPYNPFGVDTRVSFYLLDVPLSRTSVDTEDYGASLGIKGDLAADWEVHGSVRYGESSLDQLSVGANRANVAAALISSDPASALNPLFSGRGTDQNILQSLFTTRIVGHTKTRGVGALAGASGKILTLPSGDLTVALGAETTTEDFAADKLNAFAGATVPIVIDEDRDVRAAYVEFDVPILRDKNASNQSTLLDLSLAARYEDYSDFGSSTSPKIGISWRPIPDLTIRGTWGQAFQAPSLSQLYSPALITAGALFAPIVDPVLNQTYRFSNFIQRGNEGLQPQKADTLSAGLSYRHTIRDSSWHADIDFYRIHLKDRIRISLNTQELVNLESLFPNIIVRDPSTQLISDVVSTPINVSSVDTSGADLALGYETPLFGGTIEATLAGTVVADYDVQFSPIAPVQDRRSFVGFSNRFKSNLQLQYSRQTWSASALVQYTDRYQSDQPPGEVRSQTTVDLQLSMMCCNAISDFVKDVKLTAGVINLFDREPPFYNTQVGFDVGAGDPLQRRAYAKVSVEF